MNLILLQLAQTDPARDALREETMREGMSLLMMVTLLGVLLITLLALLMAMRSGRRKRSKAAAEPTDISVDAWVEAGKRMDSGITEFDEEV